MSNSFTIYCYYLNFCQHLWYATVNCHCTFAISFELKRQSVCIYIQSLLLTNNLILNYDSNWHYESINFVLAHIRVVCDSCIYKSCRKDLHTLCYCGQVCIHHLKMFYVPQNTHRFYYKFQNSKGNLGFLVKTYKHSNIISLIK